MTDAFFDRESWQKMLETERIFENLERGTAIGLLRQEKFDSPNSTMMVWEQGAGGMTVTYRPFSGFSDAGVDILFMLREEAVKSMLTKDNGQPLSVMREQIRHGQILFYALKSRDDLFEQGLEDLIDAIGVPFLGPCR